MSEFLYNEIPSLDLVNLTSSDAKKKKKFVNGLGAAYYNVGFVAESYLTMPQSSL